MKRKEISNFESSIYGNTGYSGYGVKGNNRKGT